MQVHQILIFGASALALAACYAPDVRDCTVSCSAASDCAGDQVCGAEKFCVETDIAGQCRGATVDAQPGAAKVSLRIQIQGTGRVVVAGVGACSSEDSSNGDCTWMVEPGPVQLTPMMLKADKPFERWTSANCSGQDPTCTFTASAAATVGAKFK